MEERKKQILIGRLTEYNETVNNISKFQLNKREENLFCDIMQQFAEEYHAEQLRQPLVSGRSEQLKGDEHKSAEWRSKNLGYGSKGEMVYIK